MIWLELVYWVYDVDTIYLTDIKCYLNVVGPNSCVKVDELSLLSLLKKKIKEINKGKFLTIFNENRNFSHITMYTFPSSSMWTVLLKIINITQIYNVVKECYAI